MLGKSFPENMNNIAMTTSGKLRFDLIKILIKIILDKYIKNTER